jgi:hypothetical protein
MAGSKEAKNRDGCTGSQCDAHSIQVEGGSTASSVASSDVAGDGNDIVDAMGWSERESEMEGIHCHDNGFFKLSQALKWLCVVRVHEYSWCSEMRTRSRTSIQARILAPASTRHVRVQFASTPEKAILVLPYKPLAGELPSEAFVWARNEHTSFFVMTHMGPCSTYLIPDGRAAE